MKALVIVTTIGLVLLYFVDMALKIHLFNWEMFIHSVIRFFISFIVIGVGVFYDHLIRLKHAVFIVLALFLLDDILDYFRHVDSFHFEVMLHGLYMLAWGSVTGYVFIKNIKHRDTL